MVRKVPTGARDGRKREMKMITNETARQVCFSKRRSGLFNKASELATMCGAEVAILVNSPAGRPYTFGSPAVTPVINRFLSDCSSEPDHSSSNLFGSSNKQYHHQSSTTMNHLNQQYSDLSSRIDAAKFRGLMLEKCLEYAAEATPVYNWYENIGQLEPKQLNRLLKSLYETKAKLRARQNKLICSGESSQLVNYRSPFASLMMTNNPFTGIMACQYEPKTINPSQSRFNPSSRVGLNQDMIANVPSMMMANVPSFNPNMMMANVPTFNPSSINPNMMMANVPSLNPSSINPNMMMANNPSLNPSMMMANVRSCSEMVRQQEQEMINSQLSSFNPSWRVGLNLNVTPVASPMSTFDPITYEGSSVYEVEGSSKSDECFPNSTVVNLGSIMTGFNPRSYEESCTSEVVGPSKSEEHVPHLTGGFGFNSVRSNNNTYPMNIAAVKEGLIRLNSFPFVSNNGDTKVDNINDGKPFVPLEQHGSTAQGQVIRQIDDSVGQYLCVDDLSALNPDLGPSGSNTKVNPWDAKP